MMRKYGITLMITLTVLSAGLAGCIGGDDDTEQKRLISLEAVLYIQLQAPGHKPTALLTLIIR